MWSTLRSSARPCFAWLALAWLGVLWSVLPATAQEKRAPSGAASGTDASGQLQEAEARAKVQVLIKEAAVKMAEAQIRIARARLNVLKTKVAAAQVAEEYAKAKLQRLTEVRKSLPGTIGIEALSEAEANAKSAEVARHEAHDNVVVGEAEVELEVARREVRLAELQAAQLRWQQLRERLKAKK